MELQCESDGRWQNMSGDDLVSMYKPCLKNDAVVSFFLLHMQTSFQSNLSFLISVDKSLLSFFGTSNFDGYRITITGSLVLTTKTVIRNQETKMLLLLCFMLGDSETC